MKQRKEKRKYWEPRLQLERFSPPVVIEPGTARSVGQHANQLSYRGSLKIER
ncbi:MAG: hypothetical protein AB2693_31315 [Candidatus Thiodiazotropha sp.]